MARSYTAIKRKTEDALAALITKYGGTNISSLTLYKGLAYDETLTTPRVEIIAPSCEPQIMGEEVTGNWTVKASVSVVSHYKDMTRDVHEKRIGAIEDIFMRPDVAKLINNLTTIRDYTVFDGLYGWKPGEGEDLTNGSEVKSTYHVELKCMPRRM